MRVNFILPGLPTVPVGGFRAVYEYANHLVKRGHQIAVVHPARLHDHVPPRAYGRNPYRWLRGRVGQVVHTLFPAPLRWQQIDGKVEILYTLDLRAERIPEADVVFATSWHTAEYVRGYPPEKGVKCYLIQHYETWSGPKDRVDATWRALRCVVIARWLKEVGLELGCEEITSIPYGIDHDTFRVLVPIAPRAQRAAMMYSRLDWKGSDDGLEALEIAKSAHPDLEAVLFGVPKRDSKIPSWIEYFENPPQSELAAHIYNESRVFVAPSWTEGWGLPGGEAMACGCALVSTESGGVREYAEHGVSALISPPRDPQALAHNLIRLLDDDALRVKLAEAGNRSIRWFTWERSTEHLEQFIEGAVGKEAVGSRQWAGS